MIDDRQWATVPYGVYRMRLIGPAAMLDEIGSNWDTEVEGSSVSCLEHDATELVCKMMGRAYDDMPESYCPFEFAEPELTANKFRNIDGSQQWFVAVYEVGQDYGGPEEGGWWFPTGVLVQQTAVASREEAEELREALREEFPETRKQYSVLGGEDYGVFLGIKPHPESFPETRPHYE